ncbi:MAG: hypothetical protein J6386_18115 [Candidatus Synoicihabitans palmerolidicus]|nr:hypothetical protein [Candidatus Synoicihabitans palmerolidicus]
MSWRWRQSPPGEHRLSGPNPPHGFAIASGYELVASFAHVTRGGSRVRHRRVDGPRGQGGGG